MNTIPSGIKRPQQDAIQIKLWEIYLLRSRINLDRILSVYSIDRTVLKSSNRESARISFSFLVYDWERTIQKILADNSIPYEVVSTYKTDIYKQMEKKKVYIAEDDLNTLFAINIMLEDAGYDVLMSHCGEPMLKEKLPTTDIFILDNQMPDVNGLDVCRHLKTQPETRHIPVIMISALHNIGSAALKAGVDDFLEKPFQMHDLLKLVAKHTKAADATREVAHHNQ
jgi:CheY-like chemotaxis protein